MLRLLVLVTFSFTLLAVWPAGVPVSYTAAAPAPQAVPPSGPSGQSPRPGPWPRARQELRNQYFDALNRDGNGQVRPDRLRQGTAAQLQMPISTLVYPRVPANQPQF